MKQLSPSQHNKLKTTTKTTNKTDGREFGDARMCKPKLDARMVSRLSSNQTQWQV